MRFIVAVLAAALITLTGCGGPSASSPISPSASLAHPSERDLEAGEEVKLACGLSLTVPAGYSGFLALFPDDMAQYDFSHYDFVGSHQVPPASLIQGFSVESLTPTSRTIDGFSRMPVIAGSADQGVEVRLGATRVGSPGMIEIVAVIVRNDGKPTGLVVVNAYGERATDDPAAAMRQLDTIWDRFAISGASLPPLSR